MTFHTRTLLFVLAAAVAGSPAAGGPGEGEERHPLGESTAAELAAAATGRSPSSVMHPTTSATPCDPCDCNCDSQYDSLDAAPLVDALLTGTPGCSACRGDMDGSGTVDGGDIQPFVACLLNPPPLGACCTGISACTLTSETGCTGIWLGAGSTCQATTCSIGGLTAYRPQHGTGYFPFSRTAVNNADEENPSFGPGIRVNAPGDSDPQGEDDLIEVLVETTEPAIPLLLRRSDPALRIWTTRAKTAGTEIPFSGDVTAALPLGESGTSLTIWVEWAAAEQGFAELSLEPPAAGYALDVLRFHTFQSIVMALGGEGQIPSVPVDPNHGTFVTGISLYNRGYDVFNHSESDVVPDGSGAAYTEVVNAIAHRRVSHIAIFGYSHGGGSTYFLADRLDVNRAGIGIFDITATSYVDGVENDSNFDTQKETRRPPSSGHHTNQFQVGTLADVFLDGGPVADSDPPPTGLNVETTPWGVNATHFVVDDYAQVRSLIETNFAARLAP